MSKDSKINDALSVGDGLGDGLAVLAREEWLKLQAFCDMAVFSNPSTDQDMRASLKLPKDAALDLDFKETVKLYAALKGYCTTFRDDIGPGTVGLADDIVQYARRVEVIYNRLIVLLADYQIDGHVSPEKLQKLVDDWKDPKPSPEADSIRTNFQSHIKRLKKDADERNQKAGDLQDQLLAFRDNLKRSEADFKKDFASYTTKYGQVEKELDEIKADIEDMRTQLEAARKKQRDETIVLGTSPLYMLIPFIGPFVMAGVLIGVGVDYGLLVEDLKGKVSELEKKEEGMGTKQIFFESYKTAKGLTEKTSKDLEDILPLVEKLKKAWDTLSKDLGDLSKIMSSANQMGLEEDWDFASVDLETARDTWRDLKEQADQYRRFTDIKPAKTVDELAKGMVAAA